MRAVITGGGTGGHMYPSLSIADKIMEKNKDAKLLFIGSMDSIEGQVIPEKGYDYVEITSKCFYRDGPITEVIMEAIKASIATVKGVASSYKILKKFNPDFVIGTGGFVSVPVMIAARLLKIKCYIHEQNTIPGMANKLASKFCERVFLGFDMRVKEFSHARTVFTGNPVRHEFLEIDRETARKKLNIRKDDFVLFTFGGSLGSMAINNIGMEYAKRLKDSKGDNLSNSNRRDKKIIICTGERYFDEVDKKMKSCENDEIRVLPYIKDMPEHLAASDLIVCRAGALSIAEITVCGKASILVPYPWSAGNHQYFNARALADKGAAVLADEDAMSASEVCDLVNELENDEKRLASMCKSSKSCAVNDASEKIYKEIVKTYDR